jgi:hypothetical protein
MSFAGLVAVSGDATCTPTSFHFARSGDHDKDMLDWG